jgi:hypothetical protein
MKYKNELLMQFCCFLDYYGISRNFNRDLILALLARVLSSPKLNIVNNSFYFVNRAFEIK